LDRLSIGLKLGPQLFVPVDGESALGLGVKAGIDGAGYVLWEALRLDHGLLSPFLEIGYNYGARLNALLGLQNAFKEAGSYGGDARRGFMRGLVTRERLIHANLGFSFVRATSRKVGFVGDLLYSQTKLLSSIGLREDWKGGVELGLGASADFSSYGIPLGATIYGKPFQQYYQLGVFENFRRDFSFGVELETSRFEDVVYYTGQFSMRYWYR
jgi:hypothetical protein